MIKKAIYILTLLFLILGFSATTKRNVPLSQSYRVSFGVKIGLLPTGKLTQYAFLFYRNNKIESVRGIQLHELIHFANGEWPLPKSTIFHNYFQEYGIQNDTLPDGTIVDYTAAFDSLWKVRFNRHPYNHQLGNGWSQGEFKPTLKQRAYLYNEYGVQSFDLDYFADTSFFKLLKDVFNPQWIANYKSLH